MRVLAGFQFPTGEIRSRCDLVDIVSAHVTLKKRGRKFLGLCPFHNEKTPSFNVDPDRQFWKCFGCGEGGDVFDFVQKIDGLSFPEAAEQLARRCGIEIDRSQQHTGETSDRERILKLNEEAAAYYESVLLHSDVAKSYIQKRGLPWDSVSKYRIGFALDAWDGLANHLAKLKVNPADAAKAGLLAARENSPGFYDRFRGRLMFPIMNASNRVIGFGGRIIGEGEPKYLNSPETAVFSKNKVLYGLNFARKAIADKDQAIVVEGFLDAITVQEAGFANTVATMGTALTPDHAQLLHRYTGNVSLAFDSDSAGMTAALRSGPIFEREGIATRIIVVPAGDDPDSLLRKGGPSVFAALIDDAAPLADYQIKVAMSKFDLTSDEGKTKALNQACAIVASVENSMERERLIRVLGKYHPNFDTGTTIVEDQLRREVSRLRARAVTHTQRPMNPGLGVKPAGRASLLERSEKQILGIILFQQADANKVFGSLPPNEFSTEQMRELASALEEHLQRREKVDVDALREEVKGTDAETLMVELGDGDISYPLDDLIQTVRQQKEAKVRDLMMSLAPKIADGSIRRGDPEYEEYYRLKRGMSAFRH